MSTDELAGIVPLVSVFSALFSHVLALMHDVEFFEDQPSTPAGVSWHTLNFLASLCLTDAAVAVCVLGMYAVSG